MKRLLAAVVALQFWSAGSYAGDLVGSAVDTLNSTADGALNTTADMFGHVISLFEHSGRQSVLEADLSLGYGGAVTPDANHAGETSRDFLGPALFVGAAYRSDYFLSPFLEGGYFNIYNSTVSTAAGSAATHLTAFSIDSGADLDFWRIRARAGGGLTGLRLTSNLGGRSIRTGELDMTAFLSAAVDVYRGPNWTVRLETRCQQILAAGITVMTAGLTASFDALAIVK